MSEQLQKEENQLFRDNLHEYVHFTRESFFTVCWSEKICAPNSNFDLKISKDLQFDAHGENLYLKMIFGAKKLILRNWDSDQTITDNSDCRQILIFGLNLNQDQIMKRVSGFGENIDQISVSIDNDGKNKHQFQSLSEAI